MTDSQKRTFMSRAFDLAKLGAGDVSPNPLVGCVIVQGGEIIGEGYHKKYGEAHAEVNAVRSVADPSKLKGASVFVTLEPCSHYGKTPPCADLLVKHEVGEVIVANLDPNPLVAGRGMKKLEQAGISTQSGVLEETGRWLNRRFFTFMEKKRPHITLKWAQTANRLIARPNYDSKWITDWLSRKQVHLWRTQEDAIMVGTNTAHYDNPKLTARDWQGHHPLRIVIDKHLRLSPALHLFSDGLPTICYNTQKNEKVGELEYFKLEETDFLPNLIQDLFNRKIQSLFVEGGSKLLQSFIDLNLWDEMRVFTAEGTFTDGISAPAVKGTLVEKHQLLNDELKVFRNA